MKRQRIAARLEDMSPCERAHIGPRTLKDVNSEEYAWQTTAYLKTLYGFKEASLDRWIAALEEAEQHHIYDLIPPEKPYGSMDALLVAEIGETVATSTTSVQARAIEAQPLAMHGMERWGMAEVEVTLSPLLPKGAITLAISQRGLPVTAPTFLMG